ncbi:uncharacterized protein LOC105694206 [Orussus abietinus]|uniref:uncharacterized protein LOC105694206 n=1 Tax=Orussus abietinus TaxID=222816 RepID=UPI000626AAD1|nr:uncharacterized protein LOC105694206 [Orussus abietinus]
MPVSTGFRRKRKYNQSGTLIFRGTGKKGPSNNPEESRSYLWKQIFNGARTRYQYALAGFPFDPSRWQTQKQREPGNVVLNMPCQTAVPLCKSLILSSVTAKWGFRFWIGARQTINIVGPILWRH